MKKMRKLIPAFAMLLVSAIMMSTASFAWFTMNDVVEATGMQVQAKASGNLLISNDRLTASTSTISVDFGGTKKNLTPITLTKPSGEGTTSVWQEAGNAKVDPITGMLMQNSTLTSLSNASIATDTTHFAEYVAYIATAGDTYTGDVQLKLDLLGGYNGLISNAYTIAVYIGDVDVDDWTAPDLEYNWKTASANTTNNGFVTVANNVVIPSTYGKTTEDAVGVKITIRIFVDGALRAPDETENVLTVKQFAANAKYDPSAEYVYYADAAGKVKVTPPAAGADDAWTTDTILANKGVYYYTDGTTTEVTVQSMYVNNANVPVSGTSFSIEFKAPEVQGN